MEDILEGQGAGAQKTYNLGSANKLFGGPHAIPN